MNITQKELHDAAINTGITNEQVDLLWRTLNSQPSRSDKPKFDVANVAYYFGALIVIGAMGWFMNKAWDRMGGPGLFGVATCYAICFVLGGRTLWAQSLRIPGGLLFTIAVCMVPLATFGIERWTGLWPADDPGSYANFHPYINGSWLIMEAATIAAGAIALRFWRFPFLTAPIAYALWYMSMDLPALLIGQRAYTWEEKQQISMIFGAVMLLAAYVTDLRGKSDDFAFWGYLFGLMAFWGGLSSMDSHSELGKFVYGLINIGLIFCSLILRRRIFIIFGSLGFFGYLVHLAYDVFENSILFPFALSLIGILIIYFGLQYQRRRERIEKSLRAAVLPHIKSLIPARALLD
ncbi:MAG TPA: hypothetical protein VNV15_06165 [Opitutaceae bacterium]|jgi:hypothetical protein|nr:hypothetical protein [Opitutaceae bacterium]